MRKNGDCVIVGAVRRKVIAFVGGRIILLLLCIFILGCNNSANRCPNPIIKKIDIVNGNSIGNIYYFFIEDYKVECLSNYFLTHKAEKFIDSIQSIDSSIVVGAIYYGSSMDIFDLDRYEVKYEDIEKYDGIEFYYNGRVNSRGFHEIIFIHYYQDGKNIGIYTNQ